MSNKFQYYFDIVYKESIQKDYLDFHKYRFKHLCEMIEKLRPKKIIDIGWSDFQSILKKAGYDLTSLDKEQCDLEKDKIPYEDDSFDLVIYTEVLEHLKTGHLESLREMNRILKKDGSIILTTPNIKSLRKLLFGKGQIDLNVHPHEFEMNELLDITKKANFKIIYKEYMPYYSKNSIKYLIYYLVVKLIPPFRETLIIFAKKI